MDSSKDYEESNPSENSDNINSSTTKKVKSSQKKESQKSNLFSNFSMGIFGKKKLTKAEKRFKKYKKSIKKLKNIDAKINCIFLNELTKFNNKQLKEEYDKEKAALEQKKFLNMIKFHNKIREIVNGTDLNEINKFIFENDFKTYNIQLENQNKENSNAQGDNNNLNNNNNINKKKNLNKIPTIKNFWKLSLINCQFFKINKIDSQIFNFLKDIIIIPLDYPNFRLEFHFAKNDYLKQNILTKEYFYTNEKKEKLLKSNGCDIEWEEDNKNPTLKELKKVVKDIKVKEQKKKTKIKKVKEEIIYVVSDSFFKIFDIDKSTLEKDFIEANFFIKDFFPNILEYYLNIIEIKYDDVEDELISNN